MDIKLYRLKELKITQEQFADALGISRSFVAKVESGHQTPSDNFLEKLKDVYGVDVDHMLSYHTKTKTKPSKTENTVPFYDVGVSASNLEMFDDLAKEDALFYLSSPEYKDCTMGMRVYGTSMDPYISGGDFVIVKEIKDLEEVQYGESYIVFTESQRLLKQLKKGTTDKDFLCVSVNPQYEPFNLKKSKIKRLYIVRAVLKNVSN